MSYGIGHAIGHAIDQKWNWLQKIFILFSCLEGPEMLSHGIGYGMTPCADQKLAWLQKIFMNKNKYIWYNRQDNNPTDSSDLGMT